MAGGLAGLILAIPFFAAIIASLSALLVLLWRWCSSTITPLTSSERRHAAIIAFISGCGAIVVTIVGFTIFALSTGAGGDDSIGTIFSMMGLVVVFASIFFVGVAVLILLWMPVRELLWWVLFVGIVESINTFFYKGVLYSLLMNVPFVAKLTPFVNLAGAIGLFVAILAGVLTIYKTHSN
jgi:hypothetical protein